MQRTLTTCIFLYFGDTLVFVNKEWWQGSAPISCTLPHSKPLAHWRQVRRNYLFQGGYPRYHLICTPPRRGSPSWFPQSPGTVGYGPHPWTSIPGWLPPVPPDLYSPQEGPLPGPLLPVVLPCHPNFTHSQCVISKCSIVSGISD